MRFVAFLRAINVGGHTVKMDQLRRLFEEMGLENVSTFIASGNVIFESSHAPPDVEAMISRHLQRALGYEVGAFVRTPEELRGVLEGVPFDDGEIGDGKLYVCFLPAEPRPGTAAEVERLATDEHRLRLRGSELYWLAHGSIARTDLDERALARVLGMPMTMRNVNTIRRILARLEGR